MGLHLQPGYYALHHSARVINVESVGRVAAAGIVADPAALAVVVERARMLKVHHARILLDRLSHRRKNVALAFAEECKPSSGSDSPVVGTHAFCTLRRVSESCF